MERESQRNVNLEEKWKQSKKEVLEREKKMREMEPLWFCKIITKYPRGAFITTLGLHIGMVVLTGILFATGYDIFPVYMDEVPVNLYEEPWQARSIAIHEKDAFLEYYDRMGDRADQTQDSSFGNLDIYYKSIDGSTIFTKANLVIMKALEDALVAAPGFISWCRIDKHIGNCIPPVSILRYFDGTYAHINPVFNDTQFDNIDGVLHMAYTHPDTTLKFQLFLGINYNITLNRTYSSITRSVIQFGLPLEKYKHDQGAYERDVAKWSHDEMEPILKDFRTGNKNSLDIIYCSTVLWYSFRRIQAINDSFWASGSLCFIFIVVIFHTRSFWIAGFAVLSIITVFFITNLVYNIIFGFKYLGFFHVVSVFIIIGIEVDDFFVFYDTWRHSAIHPYPSIAHRLSDTYRKASLGILFTSLTSAIAFYCNALTPILPTRSFGVFAGTAVVVNYFSVIIYFPTVVIMHNLLDSKHYWPCDTCVDTSSDKKTRPHKISVPIQSKKRAWTTDMLHKHDFNHSNRTNDELYASTNGGQSFGTFSIQSGPPLPRWSSRFIGLDQGSDGICNGIRDTKDVFNERDEVCSFSCHINDSLKASKLTMSQKQITSQFCGQNRPYGASGLVNGSLKSFKRTMSEKHMVPHFFGKMVGYSDIGYIDSSLNAQTWTPIKKQKAPQLLRPNATYSGNAFHNGYLQAFERCPSKKQTSSKFLGEERTNNINGFNTGPFRSFKRSLSKKQNASRSLLSNGGHTFSGCSNCSSKAFKRSPMKKQIASRSLLPNGDYTFSGCSNYSQKTFESSPRKKQRVTYSVLDCRKGLDDGFGGTQEKKAMLTWFFGDFYFKFITNTFARWIILLLISGGLAFFIHEASKLEPTNEEYQVLPNSHVYAIARHHKLNSFVSSYADETLQLYVVWGLLPADLSGCAFTVPDCTGVPAYDDTFDINTPENQLALKNFCETLEYMEDVRAEKLRLRKNVITGKYEILCFLQSLENFLYRESDSDHDLSVPYTKDKVNQFMRDRPHFYNESVFDNGFKDYLQIPISYWLSQNYTYALTDDFYDFNPLIGEAKLNYSVNVKGLPDKLYGNKIRYIAVQINTTIKFRAFGYEDGLTVLDSWEEFMSEEMAKMPVGLKNGFQTDTLFTWHLWIVEEKLIQNAINGLVIGICFAFPILIIATGNIIVGTLATFSLCCSTISVIGVIPLGGWKLGLLESLNMCMVVGLSVDYVVHLSQAYSHSLHPDRKSRVKGMLEEMGTSVLFGAISSMGAAMFMFFTVITFFNQFATFMLSIIGLSLLFSLVMFPTLMGIIGPENDTGSVRALFRKYKI